MLTSGGVVFLAILGQIVFTKAQTDPQDIADIACASSTSIYEFNGVDGYIESPGYPNNYEDEEDCQWYLNPSGGIPEGQELYLEVEVFSTESCCDEIFVYRGEGTSGDFLFEIAGTYGANVFFPLDSSPVTLYFNTDYSVDYPGFRVYWYMGDQSPGQVLADQACTEDTRPVTLTNNTLILETQNYPFDHPSDALCEWILSPEDATEGMYLNVLDFYSYDYLYIFFDGDLTGEYDTYWYGEYDPGYGLYSPGSSLALRFEADSSYRGFQLLFYPADPACTGGSASVLPAGDKAELASPGYPYDIPEHLNCRWLLEAPEGQGVVLTALDLNLYGDGLDCVDEYVEILDGDSVDALSLGQFCGNQTFGIIPSTTSAIQVYLRTREDSSDVTDVRTGFRFEFEAQ